MMTSQRERSFGPALNLSSKKGDWSMDVSDAQTYPYRTNREQEEEVADMLAQRDFTESGPGCGISNVSLFSFLILFPMITSIYPSYLSCFAEETRPPAVGHFVYTGHSSTEAGGK